MIHLPPTEEDGKKNPIIKMDPFENLPDELIVVQALNYPLSEIVNACQVSRRFNALICTNENFWYQKFVQDYGYAPNYRGSWRQLYQDYSAVHGLSGTDRRYTAPESDLGQTNDTQPALFSEDLLEFFRNADLGPVVDGQFRTNFQGRRRPDSESLVPLRQPLNSILFFTQPTVLGQRNPLYGIANPSTIIYLLSLHFYYSGVHQQTGGGLRLTASPAMRRYLGRVMDQMQQMQQEYRFDPNDFYFPQMSTFVKATAIRRLGSEELEALIPEVTRVYGPLFPGLKVITPEDVLGYQEDMVKLVQAYKNLERTRDTRTQDYTQ